MTRAACLLLALSAITFAACAAPADEPDSSEDPVTSSPSSATSPVPSAETNGATVGQGSDDGRLDEGDLHGADDPDAPDAPTTPADPLAGAGPKPTGTCTVTKDANGFFTRTTTKSSYVAYVPKSYDPTKPTRLVVGLHGCGDTALNFASWGINPQTTRASQDHIGISIGGKDGACWDLSTDGDKALAAIADVSKCFWVHQKKVVLAGFSSGGLLAYRLGLTQANRFAGILIQNSGLSGAGDANTLLTNAARRLPIAHRAHTSDTVFPLANVKADWTKIKAKGFPLATSEVPGTHDGSSADWATWLLPQSAPWIAP